MNRALSERPNAEHGQFQRAMIVARCRSLLRSEAQGIATRLSTTGSLTERMLVDELLIAVGRAQPRSRLVPWGLDDKAVEVIARRVVEDVMRQVST